MPNVAKAKVPNYSESQEQRIRAAAPLDLTKAKALAEEIRGDVGQYRSIIAKAISLGVEYVKAQPVRKTTDKPTKAEIVAIIASQLDVSQDSLDGLDKATVRALMTIVNATAS